MTKKNFNLTQSQREEQTVFNKIFGGALLFSLLAVGVGQVTAAFGNSALELVGSGLTLLGLVWTGVTLFLATAFQRSMTLGFQAQNERQSENATQQRKRGKHVLEAEPQLVG